MRKSVTLLLIPVLLVTMLLIQFYAAANSDVGANFSSDDWPMYLHDSAHTGVTASAGPTEPVELWRFPEGNFGGFFIGSSAAVVNGVVYVGSTYNQETRQGGAIYALNAYTGAKIWEYTTSTVRSSPAVSGNTVYVGSGDGNVYALDALTGSQIWNYTTDYWIDSSPAVVNGVVYIGSYEGNLYALNASTGSKIWNYATGASVKSSPAVVDGVVYFGSGDSNVYALNAFTGKKLWNYTTGLPIVSSPAVSDDVVYIGSGNDNLYALRAATGKKIWSAPILNLGAKALEESPSVADGVVYIGSEGFGLWALNASTGAQIWNNNEDFNFVYSSAAVVDGVVYIANLALNASTGAKIWSFPVGNEINASPAVSNGVVYIAAQDGNFYAIGEPLKAPSSSPSPPPLSSFPIAWIVTAIVLLTVFGIALLVYFKKRKH